MERNLNLLYNVVLMTLFALEPNADLLHQFEIRANSIVSLAP